MRDSANCQIGSTRALKHKSVDEGEDEDEDEGKNEWAGEDA